MPIRDYPFIAIGGGGVFTLGTKHGRPMLWVRVTNPKAGLAIITLALVDTGADDCACPAAYATRLGHNLEVVAPKEIKTASQTTHAYAHTSRVEILGVLPNGRANEQDILYTINDTQIDFVKGLDQFLLGRRTFLDRFTLFINYPERKFSIRVPRVQGSSSGKRKPSK